MLVADTRRRAYVVRLRELPALFQPVGVDHARAGIAGPIAQHCDELAFRHPRRGRRRRWTWLRASGPRRVDGGGGSAGRRVGRALRCGSFFVASPLPFLPPFPSPVPWGGGGFFARPPPATGL